MDQNQYEAKRQARYDRLIAAADKAAREAADTTARAREMASAIPLGQPILVGHHSERGDRNYRARIESKYRRGYDLHQKAKRLQARAEAMQSNRAIFSDDPAAVEKIADKGARLEARQERMREANKLVRKCDSGGLLDMGFSEDQIDKLLTPDFVNRVGFPDYLLANNSANIRRLKKRAAVIESQADDVTTEREIGGVRIVDNVEDNRLQLFFPGKPSDVVRGHLKNHGFRWSPSIGAWQRHRGGGAVWAAEQVINTHYNGKEKSDG